MKRTFHPVCRVVIIFCIVAFDTVLAIAQAPQKMNYQAVVRDKNGAAVASGSSVDLRFTIHDGMDTGAIVYTELLSTTTNQFGLINVQIGTNNNLAVVNWGNGAKYLKVEVDVNHAGSYADMGTS